MYWLVVMQACALFMTLMMDAKRENRRSSPQSMAFQDELASAKAQKTSSVSSPSRAALGRETASGSPTRPPIFSPPQSKLSKALTSSPSPSKPVLPGFDLIVAQCWTIMLDEGWETMTQADGKDYYKMPGISFFNFRPNENVFDSIVKACNKYLRDWTQAVHEDESEQSKLMDFLWPLVEKSGWTKISSSNETWYMMPNTAFNECVPNVTIFRSKALAVSKYLEVTGVLQVEDTNTQAQETDISSSSSCSKAAMVDNQEIGEDMEVDESEEDEESASEESSSEVEAESDKENNEELSDESEEEVAVVQVKSKSKKASSRTKRTKSVPAAKPKAAAPKAPKAVPQRELPSPTPAKKLKFDKPRVTIPPFKVTFGKIESELRERGWYWKPSSGDWRYFKPSCRLQDVSALKPNVDYFDSRPILEDYLDESGLYDEIRTKLRHEHEARYAPSSDSEDDEEEASPKQKQAGKPVVAPASPPRKKPTSKPISAPVSQRSSSNSGDEASKENRSDNVMPRRSRQPLAALGSFSSSRRRHSSMSHDASQAKFGDIWAALVKQGWHLKIGKFEYDYFKPHCQDASDGVQNVDYFPSRDMLVMYLQSSGIWEKTAKKLARDDAIDLTSSDDDERESEPARKPVSRKQAVFKRKSSVIARDSDGAEDERTPTGKSASKKTKVAGTFSTPTEQRRSKSDIVDDGHESDMADKISPDTGVQKAAAQDSSTSSSLPRKLADCFTPSPGALKKSKSSLATPEQSGPLKLFTDAIQNLTLGYSSSEFKYRDDESRRIQDFFQTCFTEQHGSSMYISGAPGCGKSALLKSSEDRIAEMYQVRAILVLLCLLVLRSVLETHRVVFMFLLLGGKRDARHQVSCPFPRQRDRAERLGQAVLPARRATDEQDASGW